VAEKARAFHEDLIYFLRGRFLPVPATIVREAADSVAGSGLERWRPELVAAGLCLFGAVDVEADRNFVVVLATEVFAGSAIA
jgi:hypothetical protein